MLFSVDGELRDHVVSPATPAARPRRTCSRTLAEASSLPYSSCHLHHSYGSGLREALRRVLPLLLTPEGSDVQVVPGVPHLLVAAVVDEVGPEHAVAVADERVRAMPLVHAEVLVEAVRNGVPRNELPAHSCLQALDFLLRRARGEGECGIAGVQMSGVSDLVGHHGAADACMFGPADHARLEEGPVDDQLPAAVEQVEQTSLALGALELVLLLHGQPRHPATLGGQRVTSVGHLLLLREQLLARSLPLLRRHNSGGIHLLLFLFCFFGFHFDCSLSLFVCCSCKTC